MRRGVRVTVISTISSRPPMIADELRRQADVFTDLAELQSKIGRAPQAVHCRPWFYVSSTAYSCYFGAEVRQRSHLGHSSNRCWKPIGPAEHVPASSAFGDADSEDAQMAVKNCREEDTMRAWFGRSLTVSLSPMLPMIETALQSSAAAGQYFSLLFRQKMASARGNQGHHLGMPLGWWAILTH